MSKSISLDLLTVIEHESRNFIYGGDHIVDRPYHMTEIICIFAAKI